jgi:exopolysaccharide biosynthesis WecB/TagA/CpsF family protein
MTMPASRSLFDFDLQVATFLKVGIVRIALLERAEALRSAKLAIAEGSHLKLAFANAHVVNLAATDKRFARALDSFLILADGIGVDIGARILAGRSFPANLNGTDFIPALLASVEAPLKVGLVGARPGVAERAIAGFQAIAPIHSYTSFSHGYFAPSDEPALLARLAAERPDILLVAFGNPRQETWIADRIDARHCSIVAGVGALFDFMAGEAPRAPAWMRELRLEWAFRLAHEPIRLWRRYLLGNPAFLLRVIGQKRAAGS